MKSIKKSVQFWKALLWIFVLLLLVAQSGGAAQQGNPGIGDDLVKDIMKISVGAEGQTMVMWYPAEFFRKVMLKLGADERFEEMENVFDTMRPYVIVGVATSKMGIRGVPSKTADGDAAPVVQLKDKSGAVYEALAKEKLPIELQALLGAMQPMLSQATGNAGMKMNLFVFANADKSGDEIANPLKAGSFSVEMGEMEFQWRLPLGSLVPQKTCPVDGEKFSGAYKYCPYHGVELK
jgi:hypothetical protein